MTIEDIMKRYEKLRPVTKLDILDMAIEYMQQYNGRTKCACIAMAMGYDTTDGVEWVEQAKARTV